MKIKIIPIFLITLLMCSCSKEKPPVLFRFEPERYIDTGFSMTVGEYDIEGNVCISSYEDIIFTFTYPEALSHLTLRVSSEGYFADIGGSVDKLSPEELPDNAPVKLFAEVLKAVLFEQNEFRETENGEYLTERLILGEPVTAAFTKTGKIKEIKFDNIKIGFTVSENTASVG